MTHVLPVLKWAKTGHGFKSGRDIYTPSFDVTFNRIFIILSTWLYNYLFTL